jgi:hypothetical protein
MRPRLWLGLALLLAVAWRGHATLGGGLALSFDHLEFNDLEARLAKCGYAKTAYEHRQQMEHMYALCLERQEAAVRPGAVPPLGITFSDITVQVRSG